MVKVKAVLWGLLIAACPFAVNFTEDVRSSTLSDVNNLLVYPLIMLNLFWLYHVIILISFMAFIHGGTYYHLGFLYWHSGQANMTYHNRLICSVYFAP